MKRVAMVAGCMVLAACQGSDYQAPGTDGLAPSALRLNGLARSNGNVAQIEVTIYDTDWHVLSGGDSLVVSAADGASRTLEAAYSPDYAYYAQLATPSPLLTLELVRRDGSRHPTTFSLPPSFVVTGPSATSRSAPMVATWPAEPSAPITVAMSAVPKTCTGGWTRTYPVDPGSVTLQAADFATVTGTCTVSLEVTREIPAAATGELSVGSFRLQQIRTLVLETQP